MNFKNTIATLIQQQVPSLTIEEIESFIETPDDIKLSDFAFPCFRLAKTLSKSPKIIAEELQSTIEKPEFVKEIIAVNGYLNFFINNDIFAKEVLEQIKDKKENYGKVNIGNGKKIVIDYSSPNIAKPFHVGHLRSTVIGNALYNIYNALGYTSYGINYLGDWGTQFGKLIVAYKKWGVKEDVEQGGIDALNKLYVKFHDEADSDDSLNDEARAYLVKMQNGDEDALNLWKWFKEISLVEYEKIYSLLDITFDSYRGESYYNDKMMPVVEEMNNQGLLIESNGAKIVDLEEYKMPPCLILRSDGGTLYPTRDIASVIDRYETHDFEKAIYITAIDQSLHFKQWFKVVELMNLPYYDKLYHVGFGLVSLDSGKLSTRKGHVILMEDLLNESINKTKEIMSAGKSKDYEDKDQIAKEIGIGAIIFNDLFNSRIKDVVFNWDSILDFNGETGPYVQYAHARCNSILDKIENVDFNNIEYSLLNDDSAKLVLKTLYQFESKIIDSANKNEPYIVTRYLVDVTKAFNKFYNENKVNVEDDTLRNTRALVVFAVMNVLKNGLALLGIKAPVKM